MSVDSSNGTYGVDDRGEPLSPRSEILRLKAVIAVKDACLLNFSKTLRMADDKARHTQESLSRKVLELEQEVAHRAEHNVESTKVSEELMAERREHQALRSAHDEYVRATQRKEEDMVKRLQTAEHGYQMAMEQKQAAEQSVQGKSREIYERTAQMEADAEQLRSTLRLEVDKLQGMVNAAESEKRTLQEQVDKLGSVAQSLGDRLRQAEGQVDELRSMSRREVQTLARDHAAMSEEHQADVHRLTSELDRSNILLAEARRDLEIANQHKRSREKEAAELEHRLSALEDDYRQLQRSSEGEVARLRALMASTESQAKSECGMLREQLMMARDGRMSDVQRLAYDRDAKDAEIEELRSVVVSLEGRLAQAEANRARDRELVVRSEQKLLSCEERLRQSVAAERDASERADYVERALAQKQELDALRSRTQGVKEMEVKALEHRLLMAKHEAAAQLTSVEAELRDVKARLTSKDAEARDFFQRVMAKEEELRRIGQSKQGADRHIAELNEEIACLRREVQMAVQHGAHGRGLEEVRMQLANKSIEVNALRDECRGLRMQLKDTSAMLEEGKLNIVELLREGQRKDAEIRKLRTPAPASLPVQHAPYPPMDAHSVSSSQNNHGVGGGWPPSGRTTRSSFDQTASSSSAPLPPHDSHMMSERTNALLRQSLPLNTGEAQQLTTTTHAPNITHQIGSGDRFVRIGGVDVESAPMNVVSAAMHAAAGKGDVEITFRRANGEVYTIMARPHQAEAMVPGGNRGGDDIQHFSKTSGPVDSISRSEWSNRAPVDNPYHKGGAAEHYIGLGQRIQVDDMSVV